VVSVGPAEPELGPWRVVSLASFVALVLDTVGATEGRPPVVAIDGRSSSGKTTLARRLEQAVPGATTVHTDDVAWWHSCFGWAELLAAGILEPLRRGKSVAFRPPAWDERSAAARARSRSRPPRRWSSSKAWEPDAGSSRSSSMASSGCKPTSG